MNGLLLALGVASAAYGAAMAVLYPAGGFFLVWIALAAAFLGARRARRTGAWQRASAWVRRGVIGVAAAGALAVCVGCAAIASVQVTDPPTGLDYLIVLGAGLNRDGTPSETLAYRLDAALDYLTAPGNEGTVCVVTGGNGTDERQSEAASMATYLCEHGIPSSRVIREDEATSTVENLRLSRALVPEGASVGIVTSDFHLFRALSVARRQGFAGAVGIPARVNPLYEPHNVLRECLALAKAALRGNL